ncbi:hypothetical protein EXS71_04950 [Candidatus Uhrbacteria bacterium]|nr:hypothetical protein [Candidatus Uhrbacteria bacterium]
MKFEEPDNGAKERADIELEDIRILSEHKSLGYLPVDTIEERTGGTVEDEIAKAKQRGFTPLLFNSKETQIGFQGALFVYHEKSLYDLLKKHEALLTKNHWPTDCERFVRRIATEWVPTTNVELYDLIAEAFGDKFRATDFNT